MFKVYKLGGSLLKEKYCFKAIEKIISNDISNNHKVVIVVSAIGRKNDPYSTSTLLDLSDKLAKEEREYFVSLGEVFSSFFTLNKLSGFKSKIILKEEYPIVKDKGKFILNSKLLLNYFLNYDVLIMPGFFYLDLNQKVHLFNKGGSDMSALLISKMLNINRVILFKDVGAILTGDPLVISSAHNIKHLSYDEAYLVMKKGAKVVQKETVLLAKKEGIEIEVRSLFFNKLGSVISRKKSSKNHLSLLGDSRKIILITNKEISAAKVIKESLSLLNVHLVYLKKGRGYVEFMVSKGARNFAMNIVHQKLFN